ncbi:uncharacterized protein YALI1_A02682g [Yarrowia lipolytica]|uniref:MULE transposase domain-containing protein n=1 Tax=Yarrowia lipolytica TaxID=4952 RepID=A0A1D8N3F7_YARLL|nr:hypothetical protein YALI1_A02682g [Yarrowia lipolytica]
MSFEQATEHTGSSFDRSKPILYRLDYKIEAFVNEGHRFVHIPNGRNPYNTLSHVFRQTDIDMEPNMTFVVENTYVDYPWSSQKCHRDFPCALRPNVVAPIPPQPPGAAAVTSSGLSSNPTERSGESLTENSGQSCSSKPGDLPKTTTGRTKMSKATEHNHRVAQLLKRGMRLTYPDITMTCREFDYPTMYKHLFNDQIFKSRKLAQSYVDEIAAKHGFAVRFNNGQGYMACTRNEAKPTRKSDTRCKGEYDERVRKTRVTHTGCKFSLAIKRAYNANEWYVVDVSDAKPIHNHLPSVCSASNARYRAQQLEEIRAQFKSVGADESKSDSENDRLDICDIFMDVQAAPRQLREALRIISPKGYAVTSQDVYNLYKRRDKDLFGDMDPMEALLVLLEKTPHFHCSYRLDDDPAFLDTEAVVGDLQEDNSDDESDDDTEVQTVPTKRAPEPAPVPAPIKKRRGPPKSQTGSSQSESATKPSSPPPEGSPPADDEAKRENVVCDIFFLHRKSIKFMRTFPEVIAVDCTFNTNGYNYRLFNIVGVGSDNRSFPIAHAFISRENADTFAWCLNELKKIMEEFNIPFPEWILSDCSKAFLKAKSLGGFPGKIRLCDWHADQAVLKRASKLFKSDTAFDKFMEAWYLMKGANSKTQFRKFYSKFKNVYWKPGTTEPDQKDSTSVGRNNRAYFYIKRNWFGDPDSDHPDKIKYRHMLVKAYSNGTEDFFNKTTSRVQSLHALQKSNMRSRISSLFSSAMTVIRVSLDILADLETEHSQAMEKYEVALSRDFNDCLMPFISVLALRKVAEQAQKGKLSSQQAEGTGATSRTSKCCTESFMNTSGLPCIHYLHKILAKPKDGATMRPNAEVNNAPGKSEEEMLFPVLMLGDFHPHWRNLHATLMMGPDDWDSATNYGRHRDLWRKLQCRLEKDKEIDEMWRKKDEAMLQEVASGNDFVRLKTKGDIADTFVNGTRRSTGRVKPSLDKGKACPICKKKESGHAITKSCFPNNAAYERYLEKNDPESRLERIALDKRNLQKAGLVESVRNAYVTAGDDSDNEFPVL